MRFSPMTEDELARASLLEPGVYPFEVITASEELSKAGNEMIKVKLNVFGPNDQQAHIFDYLMEKLQYKLRHFCEATGLLQKYEAGTLSEVDCEGKTGFVKIKIDPANGSYSAKNSVQDYVKPGDAPAAPTASPTAPLDLPRKLKPEEFNAKHGIDSGVTLDDDIPF